MYVMEKLFQVAVTNRNVTEIFSEMIKNVFF